MAFRLQTNIVIGAFKKPIKPFSVEWKRSIDSFSDSCSIKVPGVARLKTVDTQYRTVNAAEQFEEGMKVDAYAGYDGVLVKRFTGFIRRINFAIPVEIECEGYSYQLRKKEGYSKSYTNTTVKQLLQDLVTGTDIKLSDSIPNIPLTNIYFKNVKGIEVLEYLKDKCLLTSYFNHDVLYVGLKMTEPKETVKLRLGWNVIKDDDLKFNSGKELATVNIQIEKKNADGTKSKSNVGIKNGATKVLKIRHISDEALQKEIATEQRKKMLFMGYEGSLNMFLIPVINPGDAVRIEDKRYPQRTGLYFVESVTGSAIAGKGGRQKIKIGASL